MNKIRITINNFLLSAVMKIIGAKSYKVVYNKMNEKHRYYNKERSI